MHSPHLIPALSLLLVLAAAFTPRSARSELGPSSRRTDWTITEVLLPQYSQPNGTHVTFLELANTSLVVEDLGGHRLDGAFQCLFPKGTLVAPGERIVICPDPQALARWHPRIRVFGESSSSSTGFREPVVRLLNPVGAVLIECSFDPQAQPSLTPPQGHSFVLTAPSYGERDARAWSPSANPGGSPGQSEPRHSLPPPIPPSNPGDVVLNEIHYHPPDNDADLEFVELFNRSNHSVNLSGWRFLSGITFEFPAGASIDPNGFVVVARNTRRLLEAHPGLPNDRLFGDFRGRLANEGERIVLARPGSSEASPGGSTTNLNLVDEVFYNDGGAWGRWSDGGGSSLELRHPEADNNDPQSWADSDESQKASWMEIESRGTLVGGVGLINQIQILALGAGAIQVDNLEVSGPGTGNLVLNGAFNTGLAGWIADGTHAASSWVPSGPGMDSGMLQVESQGRGDTGANQLRAPLLPGLVYGGEGILRARARWIRGHPEILLRLRGNHLEAFAQLPVPRNTGTPGARNSRWEPNLGPGIREVSHTPVLPAPGETVTVSAHIRDTDSVARVTLRYRLDPSPIVAEIEMNPDSSQEGRYWATLPGQPAGTLLAFEIIATDAAIPPASNRFPHRQPRHEALIRFGESRPPGPLGTYRLWIPQAVTETWTRRSPMDNTPLPITFVYNDERVIHGVGAYYAGSPYLAPTYDHPTGKPCGYILHFPEDEPFLGATEIVLDAPRFDATAQQERFAYQIARDLGLPFNHRRFIRLHVNGVTESQRGTIYEDAQQVNADLIDSWLPGQSGGNLFKIEQWFEFSDSLNLASVVSPRLVPFRKPDGTPDLARLRWNWLPRAVSSSHNDFQRLLQLADAAHQPDPSRYRADLVRSIDVDEWMGVFALENIVVNFDAWGYDIGKNLYAYAPPDGTWRLFPWDIDWVMTTSAFYGYSPTSPLMYRGPARFSDANRDPTVGRMYAEPLFQRAYWRAIAAAVDGPLHPDLAQPRMEALYQALVNAGVTHSAGEPLQSPVEALAWIRARRSYLQEQLAEIATPFEFHAAPALTPDPMIRLTGSAPIAGTSIRLNGIPQPVEWLQVNQWAFEVPLSFGTNTLSLTLHDARGTLIASPVSQIIRRAGVRVRASRNPVNGHITFRGSTQPAARVQLETSPNLTQDRWTAAASRVADATGEITLEDPAPPDNPSRFYRLRVSPAETP